MAIDGYELARGDVPCVKVTVSHMSLPFENRGVYGSKVKTDQNCLKHSKAYGELLHHWVRLRVQD